MQREAGGCGRWGLAGLVLTGLLIGAGAAGAAGPGGPARGWTGEAVFGAGPTLAPLLGLHVELRGVGCGGPTRLQLEPLFQRDDLVRALGAAAVGLDPCLDLDTVWFQVREPSLEVDSSLAARVLLQESAPAALGSFTPAPVPEPTPALLLALGLAALPWLPMPGARARAGARGLTSRRSSSASPPPSWRSGASARRP